MSSQPPEKAYPVSIGDCNSVVSQSFTASQSKEVEGDPKEGYTKARRNAAWPDLTTDILGYDGVTTVFELIEEAFKRYDDRPFFGVRKVIANGKFGEYVWQTFGEVRQRRDCLVKAWTKLGLKPGNLVGVYSKNRPEWHLTELVCASMAAGTVGVYPTLGPEAVGFIIGHSQMQYLCCEGEHIPIVIKLVEGGDFPNLKAVLCFDGVDTEKAGDIPIISYSEFEAEGRAIEGEPEFMPPKPSDIWSILYTSGSTGQPKGAILAHSTIIAQVGTISRHDIAAFPDDDCALSYLPFVHALDKLVFYSLVAGGSKVGFFSGDLKGLVDDMMALQPVTIIGTPRVFDRMREKFTEAMENGGWIKSTLWSWGYPAKQRAIKEGRATPWWDAILFSKMKARVGGRVRRFFSAAAPLDPAMGEFIAICFNCATAQGYGATENLGPATMTYLHDWDNLTVGPPCSTHEVCLRDVPECGYVTTSDPPKGEVLVRGTGIFSGYHNAEELTKAAFDEDGWYKTGDVGTWDERGCLKIIDRTKSIFKLSQGEYVASEYVEICLQRCPYASQIYIDSPKFTNYVVAVVVPNADLLGRKYHMTMEEICKSDKMNKIILDGVIDAGKQAKLNGFEIPKAVILEPEPFTVENDLLTPTFKLRRSIARQHYADAIAEIAEKLGSD